MEGGGKPDRDGTIARGGEREAHRYTRCRERENERERERGSGGSRQPHEARKTHSPHTPHPIVWVERGRLTRIRIYTHSSVRIYTRIHIRELEPRGNESSIKRRVTSLTSEAIFHETRRRHTGRKTEEEGEEEEKHDFVLYIEERALFVPSSVRRSC